MNGLLVHICLFLLVALAFVIIGAFYSEAEDGPAFRILPRRLLFFLMGCAALVLVMLAIEYTVASVK